MNIGFDAFFQIIQNTRYEDIPRLCRTHSEFAELCRDPRILSWIKRLQEERVEAFLDYLEAAGMTLRSLWSSTIYDNVLSHLMYRNYHLERERLEFPDRKMWLANREHQVATGIYFDEFSSLYIPSGTEQVFEQRKLAKQRLDQEKPTPLNIDERTVDKAFLLARPKLLSFLVAETRKYPLYNKFRKFRDMISFM